MGIVVLVLVLAGGGGLVIRDIHPFGSVFVLRFLSHVYTSIFRLWVLLFLL